MEYLLWALAGAGIGLTALFLLTRNKARDVGDVMHQFGSNAERTAWRKPSASVWDESRSSPDAEPQPGERPPDPPERS